MDGANDREPNAPAPPSRLATAYHEAGHVVVATYFGLPTTKVTIDPTDDAFGEWVHPSPFMLDLGRRRVGPARRQAARQMIIASYAGLAAERMIDPQAPDFRGEADNEGAMDLSREYRVFPRNRCFVGDDTHQKYLGRLRREARRLVRKLRPAIEVLAQELLRRETIPGDEAMALVEPIIERLGVKRP